jgi:hypothetical protein
MSVFYPPPRSGGPRRATRTSEPYLTKGAAANEFYKKQLQLVPKPMQSTFNTFVDGIRSNDLNVDKAKRRQIEQLAIALNQQQNAKERRGVAAAHNAATLTEEIRNMIRYMYEHDVDGDATFKQLLKYEMRDGLDPTNRLLLCCALPFYCSGLDDEQLLKDYKRFDEPQFMALKCLLCIVLVLFYILCLVWLSFGQQTMYACNQNQPSLADQGFTITVAGKGTELLCKDLLARCYIPIGRMPLETYYSVRIASYILCTIPLLFLFASPCVLSARMLAPLSHTKGHKNHEPEPMIDDIENADNVTNMENCVNAVFCARDQIQASDFFDISAYWMVLTHWAGGIFTLCIDISTIDYVGGLDGACKGWTNDNKNLAIEVLDDRCACSVLFGPPETRGLARVSALELMSPKSVAIVLMIANFVYTLWSFGYVLQVWQFRHLSNQPPQKRRKKKVMPIGDDEDDHENALLDAEYGDDELPDHPHYTAQHDHKAPKNSMTATHSGAQTERNKSRKQSTTSATAIPHVPTNAPYMGTA